ncbi:MAG TPA: hypothetical protein RMH99_01595 [Sandaracinaceae bacterium LLY-WYZ-13_1]|nr:hypothetical protein [Sandaracinaceae bacterium LLY-WYZ-13_1]
MRRAVATLLLLAAGCESPETLGAQCDVNSDCEAPLVCRLDRCRRACVRTRDCPTRLACVLDEQGRGGCLLEEEARCVQASDCPEGLVCRFGRCTTECESDDECVPPTRCFEDPESGTNACFAGDVEPTACQRDGDCEGLQRCFADGLCRPRCLADRDCGRGEACRTADGDLRNNACVFVGIDAGSMDASVPDAGPPDAGPPDAGPPDAGPVIVPCSGPDECTAPDAETECTPEGVCAIVSCAPYHEDCDADPSTGCEADLLDPATCGGCATTCGGGDRCSGVACTDETVVELAAGTAHSCARTSMGRVVCWGLDHSGQLGDGTPTDWTLGGELPHAVPGITDAVSVCAGAEHTCVAHADGAVDCFGDGSRGQLGPGAPPGPGAGSSTPLAVTGIADAAEVVCGSTFTCVRRSGGTALCFGSNRYGQLGDGTTTDAVTPVEVVRSEASPGVPLGSIEDLEAGGDYVCARITGGEVRCWGRADDGALGDGTTPTFTVFGRAFPVPMNGVTDAVEVAAGSGSTCVRHADGSVSCAGNNNEGQLGDGTRDDRGTMMPVPGLSGAVALAVGFDHACAALDDGAVRCWGNNRNGQMGNGRSEARFVSPSDPATGLSDAVDLGGSGGHTCAVRASGDAVCWGADPYGQIGDDTGCCADPLGGGLSCRGGLCDTDPEPTRVVGL